MKKVLFFLIVTLFASTILMNGCKKESGDNGAMLMMAMGGQGTSVFSGSNPYGNFIEVTLNRQDSTVIYTDYTEPANNVGPLTYVNLPPSDSLAGGFTIFYKADLDGTPGGDYVLCVEFPDVAIVFAPFHEDGSVIDPPTFAFARKDVSQSQYYEKAFNWMHVVGDDGSSSEPDVMCGFVASDSPGTPTPNGRLYGAEYSIQYNATNNMNDTGNIAVGNLVKDLTSLAFVGWLGVEGEWDDAIVLIGNPSSAAQIIFGVNQGGGGAFAVRQASSKNFQSSYAGTYAAMVFQYDKGSDVEDAFPVTVVITADQRVQVFPFGSSTSDPGSDAIYNELMDPIEDTGTISNDLNTASLINDGVVGSVYTGIKTAYQCHGGFISFGTDIDGHDVTIVTMFDPSGRFAGFHMYDTDGTPETTDDLLSIGLAIKDKNFVNP